MGRPTALLLVLVVASLAAPAAASSRAQDHAGPIVPPPTLTVVSASAAQASVPVALRWSTATGVPAEVWVRPSGTHTESLVAFGERGSATIALASARKYSFLLYTVGWHRRLLAEATGGGRRWSTRVVAHSWIPARTPRALDRPLQVLSIAIALVLLALAFGYVRSLRVPPK